MGTSLLAQLREINTKGHMQKIRNEGLVPGIVYGGVKSTTPIQFNKKELEKLLNHSSKGMNTLIDIDIPEAGIETVMIRELQRKPTTGALMHADFYRISLSERLHAEIQLAWIGESLGVKQGGLLQPGLRSVMVECLPAEIPDRLEVVVADLEIGDKLTVADLVFPPGINILNDPDEVVVSILSARVVEEEPAVIQTPPEEKLDETASNSAPGKLAAR
jgi:large subunit ribosomal protein L25